MVKQADNRKTGSTLAIVPPQMTTDWIMIAAFMALKPAEKSQIGCFPV